MELIKSIANASPEHFLYLDTGQKIVWANTTLLRDLKKDEGIKGEACYKALFNKSKPCKECPLILALSTGHFERGVIRPEFNTTYYVKAHPLRDETGIVGVLGIISDNTENRVIYPDDLSDLYQKAQNSFLTTVAYLNRIVEKAGPGNGDLAKDLQVSVYSLRALLYRIKKGIIEGQSAR